MQYCSLGFFFPAKSKTSPSATNYAADSCPTLQPGHFNVTQAPSSSGSWSDPCTAGLRASCNSDTALHCWVRALTAASHLIFPKDLDELLTTSPLPNHRGASSPSQRQPFATCPEALQTGCCISRPWPAKPNILHLTKECEGNLMKAEPRWRQPVPELLCFSSKSQLCSTSLTKGSWKYLTV